MGPLNKEQEVGVGMSRRAKSILKKEQEVGVGMYIMSRRAKTWLRQVRMLLA